MLNTAQTHNMRIQTCWGPNYYSPFLLAWNSDRSIFFSGLWEPGLIPVTRPFFDRTGLTGEEKIDTDVNVATNEVEVETNYLRKIIQCKPGVHNVGFLAQNLLTEWQRQQLHGEDYYVKARLRIPTGTNTTQHNEIIRITVREKNNPSTVLGEGSIYTDDFAGMNLNEYQEFDETYLFSFTQTTTVPNPVPSEDLPLDAEYNKAWPTELEYEVYWPGNIEVWFDYIKVDDNRSRNLFKGNYNTNILNNLIQDDIGDHPALAHFSLKDEPRYAHFRSNKYMNDFLVTNNYAPGLACLNLQQYSYDYALLEDLQEFVFDAYPITGQIPLPPPYEAMRVGTTDELYVPAYQNEEDYNNTLQYYFNLRLFNRLDPAWEASQHFNRPLWYIPQLSAGKWQNTTYMIYRSPIPEEINAMVYTALAYGSKGIFYFMYHDIFERSNLFWGHLVEGNNSGQTPLAHNSNTYEPWNDGQIIWTGNNEKWNAVVDLNKNIKILLETLKDLNSEDVFTNDDLPRNMFTNIGNWNRNIHGDIVFGTFDLTAEGDKYFMLVNKQCHPDAVQSFDLTLNYNNTEIRLIEDILAARTPGNENAFTIMQPGATEFTVTLNPGQGKLFRITNGLNGTINSDEYYLSGSVYINGDVIFPSNSVLTIEESTQLTFANGDIQSSGEDPNKSELIVEGELISNGSSGNEIVFNSASSWYGIVVETYADIQLSYTNISNAERGLYLKPDLDLPWQQKSISNCRFENCEYGIYFSNNKVAISNSTINNNETGIYAMSGNIIFSNNTISNNDIGISVYDSPFEIYDNTISSNSKYGIYLSNASEGYFTNNLMNSNSEIVTEHDEVYSAVFLYNSSPFILSNHIYDNDKNGILLMNNSFPVIQESNLISTNGPDGEETEPYWKKAEILCRGYCIPYMNYGHNDILDNRTTAGYLIMHAGEIEERMDVSGNYWGMNGASPEGRLYPEDYFFFDTWDTELNVTEEPSGRDGEEQLYVEGLAAEKQGDFNLAKTKYNQIINQYPDSIETYFALPRLMVCEIEIDGDLQQLGNYFTTFSQNTNDSSKSKIAYNLSRRCEVQQMLYNDAIVGYEQIVQSPSSLSDSVYAVIDIGDIYLLQEELSGNSTLPKLSPTSLTELKPENQKEFEKKKNELLSLLINNNTKNDKIIIPKEFSLSQNYPNPFNPSTNIAYSLPKSTQVKIQIYNINGQLIRILIDKYQEAGYYKINWDGCNEQGILMSSGTYFYRFYTKNFVKSIKMLLIR